LERKTKPHARYIDRLQVHPAIQTDGMSLHKERKPNSRLIQTVISVCFYRYWHLLMWH